MACLIYMYWLANTHKSQSNLSDMLTCLLYIIVHLPQFVFDKLRSTLKFYMLRLYMLLLRLRAVVHKKKIMMGNNVFVCVCVCVCLHACVCMNVCVCVHAYVGIVYSIPTRSLLGPTSMAFQFQEYLDGQLVNPSWCFVTNTTYLYRCTSHCQSNLYQPNLCHQHHIPVQVYKSLSVKPEPTQYLSPTPQTCTGTQDTVSQT